jgi:glycosyltransferase involved in cell wall biosynthesis
VKIALVVPGGLHPSGEREVVPSWLALFEHLSTRHELHAFVLKHLRDAQTYHLRGFTVHDLGRPSSGLGLTRIAQDRALMNALARVGPFDLIQGFFADPAGQLAARAGKRLNIPSVVTCDSGEFVSLPEIGYGSRRTSSGRRVVAEACTLATQVHVCTQFMADLAAAHKIRATIIPLTSISSKTEGTSISAPRAKGASFRLVQVASLSRVKNQRLVIDALRLVREKVNAHLDLVGEDTLGGGLQNYAADCGLGTHVTFHGFLPQEGVRQILSTADLYVQSSLHEAAGVSVLEAAASSVPAIGTRAGYVADWSPQRAMALNNATPGSLADAIIALHADPQQRRTLAEAARAFALEHDAAWSAAKFDELYRRLAR